MHETANLRQASLKDFRTQAAQCLVDARPLRAKLAGGVTNLIVQARRSRVRVEKSPRWRGGSHFPNRALELLLLLDQLPLLLTAVDVLIALVVVQCRSRRKSNVIGKLGFTASR